MPLPSKQVISAPSVGGIPFVLGAGSPLTVSGGPSWDNSGKTLGVPGGADFSLNVTAAAHTLRVPRKSTTGDPASSSNGMIYYNSFSNKFRAFQAGAWTDLVSAGGGIGGTGTANRVSKFTAATTLGNSILDDNGTRVQLTTGTLQVPNGSATAPTFTNITNTNSGMYFASGEVFIAASGLQVARFRNLTGEGRLGINTGATSPIAPLHVNGDTVGITFSVSDATVSTPTFRSRTFSNSGMFFNSGVVIFSAVGLEIIRFRNTSGTARVGIGGVGSPSSPLHVNGDTLTTTVSVPDGTAAAPNVRSSTTTNSGMFFNSGVVLFSAVGLEIIRFRNTAGTARVGVAGVGSPVETLHVNGGVLIGSSIASTDGTLTFADKGSGLGFYGRVSGVWVKFAGTGGSPPTGSGTINFVSKWATTSSLGNSLIFDNGTNVGIGTAAPAAKFQVSNKPALGVFSMIVGDDITLAGALPSGVSKFLIGDTQVASQAILALGKSATDYTFLNHSGAGLEIKNTSGNPTTISTTSNAAISLNVGTGNVNVTGNLFSSLNTGLGLTSANTRLDLNGAFSVRGMSAPAVSPAGQGRIYFDSTANKFKASENGSAYVNLIGTNVGTALVFNFMVTKVVGVLNLQTTLQNITGLSQVVNSGESWSFECWLEFNAPAAPDISFAIDGPSATSRVNIVIYNNAANADIFKHSTSMTGTINRTDATFGSTAQSYAKIWAYAVFSASGTVNVQWAQRVSSATNIELGQGSWMRAVRVV